MSKGGNGRFYQLFDCVGKCNVKERIGNVLSRSKCVVKVYVCITNSGVANMLKFLHLHGFACFVLKANVIFSSHSLLLQSLSKSFVFAHAANVMCKNTFARHLRQKH